MSKFKKVLVFFLIFTSSLCFAKAFHGQIISNGQNGQIVNDGVFNPWPNKQQPTQRSFDDREFKKNFPDPKESTKDEKSLNAPFIELAYEKDRPIGVHVPQSNGIMSFSMFGDLFYKYNVNDLEWRNGKVAPKKGAQPHEFKTVTDANGNFYKIKK